MNFGPLLPRLLSQLTQLEGFFSKLDIVTEEENRAQDAEA
jgi:hypothetical protein